MDLPGRCARYAFPTGDMQGALPPEYTPEGGRTVERFNHGSEPI